MMTELDTTVGRSHTTSALGPGRLAIDTPEAGTSVIRVQGALNSSSGARLLRLVDAQFELRRAGHRRLDALVTDISEVRSVGRGGPEALAHAEYGCARRGIRFAIAGQLRDLTAASPTALRRLRRLRSFPTVNVAVASLTAATAEMELNTPAGPWGSVSQ